MKIPIIPVIRNIIHKKKKNENSYNSSDTQYNTQEEKADYSIGYVSESSLTNIENPYDSSDTQYYIQEEKMNYTTYYIAESTKLNIESSDESSLLVLILCAPIGGIIIIIGIIIFIRYICKKCKNSQKSHLPITSSTSSINEKLEKNNELKYSKFEKNKDEKPIAIIFSSIDQSIHYAIACYISDKFSVVKEELFNEYPELKNKNIYFLVNGQIIDTSSTLEQNKIKNGANILINFIE